MAQSDSGRDSNEFVQGTQRAVYDSSEMHDDIIQWIFNDVLSPY